MSRGLFIGSNPRGSWQRKDGSSAESVGENRATWNATISLTGKFGKRFPIEAELVAHIGEVDARRLCASQGYDGAVPGLIRLCFGARARLLPGDLLDVADLGR
jgi:hypothetical protein